MLKTIIKFTLTFIFRVKVYDKLFVKRLSDTKNPFIIASNLTSTIDLVILWCHSPKNTCLVISNDFKYLNSKILNIFLKQVDYIFLDFDSEEGLKPVVDRLKKGQSVLTFPEGKAGENGTITKLHPFIGKILDECLVPILPAIVFNKHFRRASGLFGTSKLKFLTSAQLKFFEPTLFKKLSAKVVNSPFNRQNFYTYLVYEKLTQAYFATQNLNISLFAQLLDAKTYFKVSTDKNIFEDINFKPIGYRRFLGTALMLARKFNYLFKNPKKIGLMLPNSTYFCACFYAMQAAGITSFMVNYSAGVNNVLVSLKNSQVKLVITSRLFIDKAGLLELAKELEKHVTVFYLEDLAKKISFFDKLLVIKASLFPKIVWSFLFAKVRADKVAVILSTSGSEARPKSVALTHRNFVANCYQVLSVLDLSPKEVLLNVLPGFHAFGLLAGVILPASFGIKSFQYPSPLHYDKIPQICYKKSATILFATNAFLKGYAQKASAYDFKKLRLVVAGAEALSEDTKKIYAEKFGIKIFEGYGCTETAPVIALNTVMFSKHRSVGRVLPGIKYKVDAVPGFAKGGELKVSGPNNMLGYFAADDSGEIDLQAAWYATGDIVEVDEQKFVTLLGRKKRFIKVGGEAISLNLLEEVLKHSFADYDHAALGMVGKNAQEYIVLYTNHAKLDKKLINTQLLAAGLTGVLNPKFIRYVDALPLLGSGKVNYPLLKEMFNQIEKK